METAPKGRRYALSYSLGMPIYRSRLYRESALAHRYLDGLRGIEIGGSYHNAFGLDTLNVDYSASMSSYAKLAEIDLCGHAMPVDVVAWGDRLPFADKSVDFVISSHVIEHFFDPVATIEEWLRVARRYIFIICPHRDALEHDRKLPLTSMAEFATRHAMTDKPVPSDEHHSRWTPATFVEMCVLNRFNVVDVQERDDKVGNGFSVVIDATDTIARRTRARVRQLAHRALSRFIARETTATCLRLEPRPLVAQRMARVA